METQFNWDMWALKTSFFEIWNKTAYLQDVRAIPTCYSPDGKKLYLSSLDIAVNIDSVRELEQAIEDIIDSYKARLNNGNFSNTKLNLAIRECDFEVVCNQLNVLREQGVDQTFSKDYDYSYSEKLFKKLTAI